MKIQKTSIIEAIADKNLFADTLSQPADLDRMAEAFLATLFGHPMDAGELEIYRKHTGRQAPRQRLMTRLGWFAAGVVARAAFSR